MGGRWRDLHAGQFIGQQADLVYEDREALRADVFRFFLEGQVQQRHLLVRTAAILASGSSMKFSNGLMGEVYHDKNAPQPLLVPWQFERTLF
jgi:hypothetical protein